MLHPPTFVAHFRNRVSFYGIFPVLEVARRFGRKSFAAQCSRQNFQPPPAVSQALLVTASNSFFSTHLYTLSSERRVGTYMNAPHA
jgi:hypothetical protein